MASREFRAFGILLLAGFMAGFCLSSGSAHYFAPATAAAGGGGGAEEPGGGGGGGGGKQASQHGGIEQDGKGPPAAGAAGQAAGGTAAKEKSGAIEDGADAPPAAPKTAMTENEVVAFLAGNTIALKDADKAVLYRYMSKRGWQGDTDASRSNLVVHRWIVRTNQLCEVATEQTVACDAVTIAKEDKPGKDIGAKLGTITMASGLVWPVLRGNVANVPEVMPLIDGLRRLRSAPAPAMPSAKGPEVMKAIVGHPMVREGRDGEPVSGVFYDPDGRWVTTQPLEPGARTGLGGIRVTIGQWAVRGGALCLDEPGLQFNRKCYAPQEMGEAAFRLVPIQPGTPTALSVIAEGA